MGLVAFGTWWFGETDAVEGFGAVHTRFFHFMAIPIVPLDSLWVTHASWSFRCGASIEGKPIPLQWKSVVLGYLPWWRRAGPAAEARWRAFLADS